MSPGWTRQDSHPVIARLINELFAEKRDWVTHGELLDAMRFDQEGRQLIEQFRDPSQSEDAMAGDFLALFSQDVYYGRSNYSDPFTKEKVSGETAYRPIEFSAAPRFNQKVIREVVEMPGAEELTWAELYEMVTGRKEPPPAGFRMAVRIALGLV